MSGTHLNHSGKYGIYDVTVGRFSFASGNVARAQYGRYSVAAEDPDSSAPQSPVPVLTQADLPHRTIPEMSGKATCRSEAYISRLLGVYATELAQVARIPPPFQAYTFPA